MGYEERATNEAAKPRPDVGEGGLLNQVGVGVAMNLGRLRRDRLIAADQRLKAFDDLAISNPDGSEFDDLAGVDSG